MTVAKRIDESAVLKAYARWAPVYDYSFGLFAEAARKYTVQEINKRVGRVLEVGVGTGMSLPQYQRHLKITGIDLSPEMLAKARDRVRDKKLDHVEGIREMDASVMDFADNRFDTVVAMYVMTVVPDPVKVMSELERVCKPGGEVIIINHFAQDHGIRARVERWMAPASRALGWHPDFKIDTITDITDLKLIESKPLWPLGLFTLLKFKKPASVSNLHSVSAPAKESADASRRATGERLENVG